MIKGGYVLKRFLIFLLVPALLSAVTVQAIAATGDFQKFLKANPTVRVFVELKNSSVDDKVNLPVMKKLIEEAFLARKAHRYVIADAPSGADLIFRGDVVEYVWMENDPVDQVWGVSSAAMDAAMSENYARMQVRTSLVEAKHNRELWGEKVQATMTKASMPKEASYELVYPRYVKAVLIELFKKRVTGSL